MSNVERTTSWQRIQQGLREAEQLISRKEYNLVMVKARLWCAARRRRLAWWRGICQIR